MRVVGSRRTALHVAGVLLVVLLCGTGLGQAAARPPSSALAAAPCSVPGAGERHAGVPAYVWDTAEWRRQLDGRPATVVFNPSSGPGQQRDAHFSEQVGLAAAAGTCLLGYVRTDYGRRPVKDVQQEVDSYRRWYGVTSVFFDEASYQAADAAYYSTLARYVRRTAGALVALNPGMVPEPVYADIADLLVVFEGSADQYDAWTPPSWTGGRAAHWHLVHSTPDDRWRDVLAMTGRRGGAVVYVTDDVLDNPWDAFPPYLLEQLATVRGAD